jgi:hypothetical protein
LPGTSVAIRTPVAPFKALPLPPALPLLTKKALSLPGTSAAISHHLKKQIVVFQPRETAEELPLGTINAKTIDGQAQPSTATSATSKLQTKLPPALRSSTLPT